MDEVCCKTRVAATRYSVKPWELLSQVLYTSMFLFFVKLLFTSKFVKIMYIHSLYFKKY
jgi:hypothetical protein